VGYLGTGPFDPVGNDVFNVAISDNHVGTTATNEDVCAVMNGCR
jgi:hypothetical protein